ncbi:MAG: RNA polymerase sigma factor [Phycisphaerales bacterium]|nr:RNA polymerase sigma factor [Phycisphaerales bacterium]
MKDSARSRPTPTGPGNPSGDGTSRAGSAQSPGEAQPSDAELVTAALRGDRAAFDQIIRRHQRQAVAVSYRLLGNINDALEVTQESFLKAYRNLNTLQTPAAFAGWMMRIVSNLSLNFRRGRKIRSQLPLDDLLGPQEEPRGQGDSTSSQPDPARAAAGRELGERLQAALAQLPQKQRDAILLFTVEQLPQKQVAEILDCSVEAVKWHVFQGRKRLRELLKDVM